MTSNNATPSPTNLAWEITQRLAELRCAQIALGDLRQSLRVGVTVEMPHLEKLTAANIVIINSLETLEHLRSEVDQLPDHTPANADIASAGTAKLPEAATRHLRDLQMRAMEVSSVLRLIDQDSGSCATSMVHREAAWLAEELDPFNVERAMNAAPAEEVQ